MRTLKQSAGVLVLMVIPLLVLFGASPAMALSSYLTPFNTLYPNSTTGTTAWSTTGNRCNVCHSTGGGTDLNPYGRDWAEQHNAGLTPTAAFQAIEGINSDGNSAGATNLQEITANAQPGYTAGATQLYDIFALTPSTILAGLPTGLVGSLDPAATNLVPIANAGPAQAVNVGQTVQLNGSASSDPEGHLLTYSWSFVSQPAGSALTLTNPTTVNPTFTPNVAGTYTVQLIVNDGTQNSAPATVIVTAAPAANLPPVANAGPAQAVAVGQLVTLDGSASTDPERQVLTYNWSLTAVPAGSTATLAGATTVHPTFTPNVAGSYTVQLIVNDGTQNSAPATVTISAAAQNLPPVASAGPAQAVNVGQLVTLNGSGSSDPEGHALTYSWSFVSRPAGSAAVLTSPTTVNPTFTTDAAGNFVVQLIVNDGTQNSAAATVTIAATAQNLPPVANAGSAQTVAVGVTVTLNGSGSSDPEGHALTYSWSFVSRPAGSAAVLTNPTTVNPTFVADVAGQYVVGLVVNDSVFSSPQTNVVVTASATPPANRTPTVTNPGNKAVTAGQLLSFTITGSDPDGNTLTFAATSALPTGATLSPSGAFSWTPTAGQAGATPFSVTVTATDNGTPALTSAPVTFTITVTATPTTTPLTVSSITATQASPVVAGTAVTLTATATGGTAPYQFKWWVWNGSAWAVAREWGTGNTLTWTPTAPGNYEIHAWVRNTGVTADTWQAWGRIVYTVTNNGVNVSSITATQASPVVAGTAVTLTATATGGTAPYQFKWWVWNGSAWAVAREWGTGNTLTWTPTAPGNYEIHAWVRNTGVTADTWQAWGRIVYTVTAAPAPTLASVTANRTGIRPVGRALTLTATATGGTAPYQFKWWVWNGSAWAVAREWGTGNTLTWTPTAPGNYEIHAWVRNTGVTADTWQAWGRVVLTVAPQVQVDDD